VEQKETVEAEFERTIESFRKYATAWKTIGDESEPRSGRAAYAAHKVAMYSQLATDCVAAFASAPGLSEKDRVEEEEAATAELERKGLLNQKLSDSWKVRHNSAFWYPFRQTYLSYNRIICLWSRECDHPIVSNRILWILDLNRPKHHI
jgi:hypothetical protein